MKTCLKRPGFLIGMLLFLFGCGPKEDKKVDTIPAAKPVSTSYVSSQATEVVVKPQVGSSPVFSAKEVSPFSPDVVVLTSSFSELPKDLVNNSFLGKVITKETMFYYEDDPSYMGLLGTVKRLSYEHKLDLKDNILKYLFSTPGEIAFWKRDDGKLKDFLFIANEGSLNKNIINFYLKLKKIGSDSNISTFTHGKRTGYHVKIRNQKLSIWSDDKNLFVTNLSEKYFPDRNEKKLKEVIAKTVGVDNGQGFYKRLYNIKQTQKHSIIINSEFLSFGYDYFIPSLKAVRLDFNKKKWNVHSLVQGSEKLKVASTKELWKAFPKSTAMCAGLPFNVERVSSIVGKYKELTKKRLEKELAENKPKAKSDEGIEKLLLSDEEISELAKNVVAACWYKESTIYTPLFISKISNIKEKSEKIKFLFDKFIGGLENEYKYSKITEKTEGQITSLSRAVSSKYGTKDSHQSNNEGLKYKRFFDAKLAFNDNYILFSPDGDLVDLAVSTLNKKNPSVHDELKISDKNISYLLNPHAFSELLNKYMKEALPNRGESVFRTAVEKHLTSAFKNLSTIKPFGLDMPKASDEKVTKWEELKIHDL